MDPSKFKSQDDIGANSRPRVSVIIPIYNASEFLDSTLTSLLNQTMEDFEAILIDDGSTDNSLHICHFFESEDPRFRVFSQPNSGVSNARNRGIESARGSFLAFLDADDSLPPDALSIRLHLAEKFNVDCVRTEFRTFHGDARSSGPKSYVEGVCSSKEVEQLRFDIAVGRTPGYTPLFLFDTSFIRRKNLKFRRGVSMMEDTLFLTELLQEDVSIYLSNEETYDYRVNPSGATLSSEGLPDKINSIIAVNHRMQLEFGAESYPLITAVHLRIIASMFLVRFDKEPSSPSLRKELKRIRKDPQIQKMEVGADLSFLNLYDRSVLNVVFHQGYLALYILISMRKILGR